MTGSTLLGMVEDTTALLGRVLYPDRDSAGRLRIRTVVTGTPPPAPDGITVVDLLIARVVVDVTTAQRRRQELCDLLARWPAGGLVPTLEDGPGYKLIALVMGSDNAALRFLALGAALDLWQVSTPATRGITGPEALSLARGGWVILSGWKQP